MNLARIVLQPTVDPQSYVSPTTAELYDYGLIADDQADEEADEEYGVFKVGAILADEILFGTAVDNGMHSYQAFDCEGWGFLHPVLFSKGGELRKAIGIEESIDSVVIIYRQYLAPCLATYKPQALHLFMQSYSCYTLFVFYDPTEFSESELIACGFMKLARTKACIRHNAYQYPACRSAGLDDVTTNPTQADEDWVNARLEEYRHGVEHA